MNSQATDLEALKQRLQQRLSFLKQDPDNVQLYLDTVDLAISLADWAVVETLLSHPPVTVEAAVIANFHAVHYLATHRPDLAVAVLQPFLDQNEQGGAADTMRYNAAFAFALKGDLEGAENTLTRHPVSSLSDDMSYLLLHVYMLQGRIDEAVRVGRDYWRAGRRGVKALSVLALALTDIGAFEEAETAARQALLQAEDSLALCAMGMVMLGTSSATSAKSYFERSLRQDSRNGRAWLGLGMCLMVAGELAAAKDVLQNATQLNSEHPGSWHVLGWTLLAMNQVAEAEQAFAKALDVDRNFADSHGALAVVSVARGHLVEAEQYAAVALRLDPRSLAGNYARALISEGKGNPARAQTMIKSMLTSQMADGASLLDSISRVRRQ